ncbi:hypothetical protein [Caulobacter endophyticus]|uniref:hypothetical protein n=1 Tax=Caulobacter endophyticus TaxID=2172652 RepID=UPI00240F17B7|nr:hypothetical protein [Caulobacter endophyticus]MDG2531824.1 hypothetical protein [Caulobacter endophyticus]
MASHAAQRWFRSARIRLVRLVRTLSAARLIITSAIAVLAILATLFFQASLDVAMSAMWMMLMTSALLAGWAGLSLMVGIASLRDLSPSPSRGRVRERAWLTVITAVALATLASPLPPMALGRLVERSFVAAFKITPALTATAMTIEQTEASKSSQPEAVSRQLRPVLRSTLVGETFAFMTDAKADCTVGYGTILGTYTTPTRDCAGAPGDQTAPPAKDEARPSYDDLAAATLLFTIVLCGTLLLGRALNEARLEFYGATDNGAQRLPPVKRLRETIVSYPKWVAAIVYAALLLPATYLSVGSLLFLTMEELPLDLEKFRERLDAAEASATSADRLTKISADTQSLMAFTLSQRFGTAPVKKDDKALTEQEQVARSTQLQLLQHGLERHYLMNDKYEQGRNDLKSKYTNLFIHEYKQLSKNDFELYTTQLVNEYYNSVLYNRIKVRECIKVIESIQLVLGGKDKEKIENLTPTSSFAEALAQKCTTTTMGAGENSAPSDLKQLAPPHKPGIEKIVFSWMEGLPKPALLIVGMIGFGLFGAAIRMLGRPDSPERRLREMPTKLQTAIDQLNSDAKELFAKAKGAPSASDLDAQIMNINAAMRLHWASSNNVVYSCPEYVIRDGRLIVKERIAVSEAPARVLVHGLGAAFTVFLFGQAGSRMFHEGGQTSYLGLLATCFVGAVFAEDIWKRARPSQKDEAADKQPH